MFRERERELQWSSVLLLLVAGHTLHEVFVLCEGRCLEREREVKWSSVLLLLVAGHTLHEVFVLREGRCREREREQVE